MPIGVLSSYNKQIILQMTMRKWLLTLLLKYHCKQYINQRIFGIPMLTTNKTAYQQGIF